MTQQLDLLLVNPNSSSAYGSALSEARAIEPPVWCAMLSGYARRKGYSVEVLDANAEELQPLDMSALVARECPKIAAVVCYGANPNASTQTMPSVLEIADTIKRQPLFTKVLILGGHVAALPERTLQECGADYAATGEGSAAICDLLAGKKPHECRGLAYRQDIGFGDAAMRSEHREPLTDVADLEPAFDLLPDPSKYRCHNWHGWTSPNGQRSPYAAFYTSLGCPYSCSFCCIQAPFKEGERQTASQRISISHGSGGAQVETSNSYRRFDPERVGAWIHNQHYERGVSNIKVADEMFVLNKRHVEGVCDAIMRNVRSPAEVLNLWAYARVDTCNDQRLLEKMRRAGFRWLALGIESADGGVRDGVNKGYRQDSIHQCVERVKAAGIHVGANYIFGLPDDTIDSMRRTYDLAVELNTPYANFYSTAVYPGSQLWETAPEEYRKRPWTAFAQFGPEFVPLVGANFSPEESLRMREHAWQSYYKRPHYLAMMERQFGASVMPEVRKVGAVPLKFNLLEKATNEVHATDSVSNSGGAVLDCRHPV